jgi:uncharacterized RDD family membrane protein YckC
LQEFNKEIFVGHLMNAQFYFDTGMLFIEKEKYEEAISCFEESIKLKSDFSDAYFGLGVCKIKLGDIVNGEAAILKSARLGNKYAQSYADDLHDGNKNIDNNTSCNVANNGTDVFDIGLPRDNGSTKATMSPQLSRKVVLDSLTFSFATRWPRFFARIFDTWCEILLVSFALGAVLGRYSAGFVEWINGPGASQLFGVLCLPIGLILDASLYRLIGNTPGKALLGLKVKTFDNRALSYSQYLGRNFEMWLSGLALGIPLINLFTMGYQSSRLGKGQQASYDQNTGYRVHAKPIGSVRKAGFGFAFVGIFLVIAVLHAMDQTTKRGMTLDSASQNYSWENPITHRTANINSQWRNSTQKNSNGQQIYIFSERADRSVVVFAVEHAPGYALSDYVQAFQKSTAATMRFSGGGSFFERDGHQIWQGSGVMVDSVSSRLKVQVIQIGNAFWRVVTVQAMPYDYSDNFAAQLQAALWSTVK